MPAEAGVLLRLGAANLGYRRRHPVLAGVELELRAGEFVGLEGPNGSGKSTLLRTLLGLLPPLTGELERAPVRIGYVPQRERLDILFPLSVREVVELGARRRPGPERVLAALEAVGLGAEARAPFSRLSGGQRQRVLLARALVSEPELLALDEPTVGVDEESLERIESVLATQHAAGTTLVLVSHDAALLRRSAHSFWHVCAGQVRSEAEHVG